MVKYVYALIDPDTHIIRYVGCSKDAVNRYEVHKIRSRWLVGNQPKFSKWMIKLAREGKNPTLVILEKTDDDNGDEREKWWISHLWGLGHPLCNKCWRPKTRPKKII